MQDLTGKKFGRLTVLELHHSKQMYNKQGKKDGHYYYWKCQCECGNIINVWSGHLISGHTFSCGCYKNELLADRVKKHGLSKTRICKIYRKMKGRCYNPNNPKYYTYGARGITICEEWLNKKTGLINFYNWSMANGYRDDLSIDRVDNNKGYSPANCRWADNFMQANNKTINHYITYKGETKTLAQWARTFNMKYRLLLGRIKYGWDFERAITQPVRRCKNGKN